MTGRRRSSHTSHHDPGAPHTTHHHGNGSDGGTATATRHHGGGGASGVGVHLDGIETMASRLDATRGRVEGVANTVRGVNVGPQSMGLVGSGFTGTAQAHLRTAEQHLARTTEAVEQAQRGTRGTAQAYRDTDAANAAALNSVDTTSTPPRTRGGPATTIPSAAATATAPSAPPATRGGAATTPSAATTAGTPSAPPARRGPAGVGGPPPPPPGPPGGGGPPPPSGPGGGGPPHHPAGTGSGTPIPWREDLKNHFTPSELDEINTAMGKMAADPTHGEVPGSGQLTQRERELLAQAQHLVVINPDTMMQKVLPPGALDNYLAGHDLSGDPNSRFNANQVGGFVARQQDATHLQTPADLIRGNRLDYENTPFKDTSKPVHVMEFPAGTNPYTIPFGAPYAGGSGLHGNWGVVQHAADDMITAADSQGHAPGSYRREVNKWPFSGVGLTADADLGIPERTTPYHQIPDGSVIYEYTPGGDKVPVARYVDPHVGWKPIP